MARTSVLFALALPLAACASPPTPVAPPPPVASQPRPPEDPRDRSVPFEIGLSSVSGTDDLRIEEVRGDKPTLESGGTYRVRGHYRLGSRAAASIMIHTTGGDSTSDLRRVDVTQGDGTFEVHITFKAVGHPHVAFYPIAGGDSFGGVYFGQGESLNRSSPPSVDAVCYPDAAEKLGWTLSGGAARTGEYCVSPDEMTLRGGKPTAHMKHMKNRVHGAPAYGTLMKQLDATPYRGKRVRIELDVRTLGASGRRDFWARVQAKSSPGDGMGLGGDSAHLAEAAEWGRRTIVLDVPESAAHVEYGVGLAGPGELWVDADAVTVVDEKTPLTNPPPVVVAGWRLVGVGRQDYSISTDAHARHAGHVPILWQPSGATKASERYAAVVRALPALELRGQRVRLTRWARTKDASEVACIAKVQREPDWTYGPVLAIDFEKLAPSGDWYRCETVLDVGPDASWLLVGITGRGAGQTWVDDVKLEVVPRTTPLSNHSP